MELFKTGRCFPLKGDTEFEDSIHVAVSDPYDLDILLEIEAHTHQTVKVLLTRPSQMEHIRKELFEGENALTDSVDRIAREYNQSNEALGEDQTLEEIKRNTESEPVVKLVDLIFREAIKCRASDIHIEPLEHKAVTRFRVDGMLKQHMEIKQGMYIPLTSRIKILAELDIAEKRMAQDGRIRYIFENSPYDFRVSTLPTHYGEKTVIRILKHDFSLLDLNNIGLDHNELKVIDRMINKPQGMIFVTGPTGSGKSSTLFACLNKIRKKEINITTIENPVEYKLEGINQVQVNEKAGLTFANTLRSILRQDPDVILIGEIRDTETAEIAIRASQTGHLVLSTLHTNDAISAVTRLKDLGIPGYLVSSSLLAVIAQRLIRVLCPSCKAEQPIPEDIRFQWERSIGKIPFSKAYFPVGCSKCSNSGFIGRDGIFEVVPVTEEVRSLVVEENSEAKIRQHLKQNNSKTLITSAIEKIKKGITPPDEVLRVVLIDDEN